MIGISYILLIFLVWFIVISISWLLSRHLENVYENRKSMFDRLLLPIENLIYKAIGVDRKQGMNWKEYFLSLFLFTAMTAMISFLILLFQGYLPLNPMSFPDLNWSLALNTALSMSSNTNLQHYAGGTTLSYLSQMVGIQFLQFTSAATGVTVAVAIFRGFSGRKTADSGIGNFYVDLVRTMTRVLIPLSLIAAIILVSLGIPQSLSGYDLVRTLSGATQIIRTGPVASLVSIMQIGTNGGGYYGANSAYPFQNPSPATNFLEIGMMMLLPTTMMFLFGRMIRKKGEGRTMIIASYALYSVALALAFVPLTRVGPDMEIRFGAFSSVLWTVTTTAFTTGSLNTSLSALNPLVIVAAFLGMLVQAMPGGIGVGAMYLLMYIMITVFIVGLMAGRTPEYLGSKITAGDIKLAVMGFLTHPVIILVPTIIAFWIGAYHAVGVGNGSTGFTEIFYEFTSAAANNGSDFLGSSANNTFFNVSTGVVMWTGRFVPIFIMLAIAGRMADRKRTKEIALRTDDLIFPVILVISIFILAVLTFLPFLAIGPVLMFLEGLNNAL